MSKHHKTLLQISILIFILGLGATLGGLLIPGLYQDNPLFNEIWRSNDLITLLIALPLLGASVGLYFKTKSVAAELVWYSVILFFLYNYAYYVFGAHFNAFYLIHLAIYTLSLIFLVLAVPQLPMDKIRARISPRFPRAWIIGYMLFISVGLLSIYVMQSLVFAFGGALPAIISNSGHVTSVVFTLDISLVVAFYILGAVLLWKKNPWGFVIGWMLGIKGSLYMGVLTFASIRSTPNETGLWAVLGLLSVLSVVVLVRNFREIKQV